MNEPTGKVKQNEIQTARCHGHESRRLRRRTDKARDSEIGPYVATIKGRKRLSVSEEKSLAEAIARGDKDALSRLIECNLGLVVKHAQECTGHGATIDDLIGAGNVALIRAAEQYQPSHGVRFSTYASVCIKKAIRREIASSAIIRLPHHILALSAQTPQGGTCSGAEMDRKPTFDEVASSLGLSNLLKSRLARAQLVRNVQQESTDVRENGGWSSAHVLDPSEPFTLANESPDDKRLLESRLECLDEQEKQVLSMRHGFGKDGPMTLARIARIVGVNKESVRMIELRAAQKLRIPTSPQTSDLAEGSGRKKRRRRGGTIVWPGTRSSRRRRRTVTGIQSAGRDAGGAELKAAPSGAPDSGAASQEAAPLERQFSESLE